MKKRDPTMTTEIAIKEMSRSGTGVRDIVAPNTDPIRRFAGGRVPAFFFWYWHAGFRERWNKREWGDESLPRDFDEYFDEALSNGWWDGLQQPAADVTPRVLIECGGNMLRRTRGGKTALLESLWPKLRMIVTIDFRISQTALYADYVLPAAQHYEKIGFGIPTPHVLHLTFSDRAAKSPGEARTERDIYLALLRKIEERTAARGLEDFERQGERRRFDDLVSRFTQGGQYRDEEHIIDEGIRDSALAGTLPPRTTIETFREKGHVRFIDLGLSSAALSSASPIERDKTFVPFRNQVESGHPFPTYARRAQFYIDHDWFMEAGEELPTYKPNPNMGGDYPIGMTSGHNRWSIHAMNQANKFILGTHRGEPHVMVNPDDATARGVEDDDLIRVFNDLGEFHVRAKTAPNVRRGQLISYNGWAGFQYAGWNGANEIEPGMVKWIGLAGGYGHLRYAPIEWQPVPVDRWVRCDFEKMEEPR
jgi:anaerobic selenocysteine-containing dehydrogenase